MHKIVFLSLAALLLFALTGCGLFAKEPQEPSQSPPPGPVSETFPDAERFSIIDGPYFPFAQLEDAIQAKLGPGYRFADWDELTAHQARLPRFLDAIKLEHGASYFVLLHGEAHPDAVAAAGVSAQHPGPAAFRFLAYRGPASELQTHFEDLVILDASLDPDLVLYRSWNKPGNLLIIAIE